MAFWTLLLISVGVAMDAAAVSASAAVVHTRFRDAIRLATTFGLFQIAMAMIGWVGGTQMINRIGAWDHWIAFALLASIGVKMIYEALHGDGEKSLPQLTLGTLFLLGIATSIDSLAVGVTLPMLELPRTLSIGMIGAVTFAIALAAALAARRLVVTFGPKLEILGGVVLIGIGIKILVDA